MSAASNDDQRLLNHRFGSKGPRSPKRSRRIDSLESKAQELEEVIGKLGTICQFLVEQINQQQESLKQLFRRVTTLEAKTNGEIIT